MISIITSIYNQLPASKIFYESLEQNMTLPYELIIIDNESTDGSKSYFQQCKNVQVISTGGNYNYPYCQNIGIEKAKYKYLCFFNNDIITTSDWDKRMVELLEEKSRISVLSFATNDHVESKSAQKKIARRWKKIKYPLQYLFGNKYWVLKLMISWMYRDLNSYADRRYKEYRNQTIEGYSGSAIMIKKEFIADIGLWDERIQGADYDLFNRVKEYALQHDDVAPIQLALGIYFHHFQRLTIKGEYPPFSNKDSMISVEEKWGDRTQELRKDIIG